MILVTGSTGFVGCAVVARLLKDGHEVREITRNPENPTSHYCHYIPVVDETTDWNSALDNIDVVIHCAAMTHQMNESKKVLREYVSVNTAGSTNLAESCIRQHVRRLVYVSTIKVCAETTRPNQTICPDSPRLPSDDYSRTKADAEVSLLQLADESQLELVIVRPPLVYGPGAKGNLESLVKLLGKNIPLPLGAINNRRSIVGLENLADFLALTTHHPLAKGQIFNISDGQTVSTTQILRILGRAMNKRTFLIPIPQWLLKLAARITGTTSHMDRLMSNLEVDSTSCTELLDWIPPRTTAESVASLINGRSCKS